MLTNEQRIAAAKKRLAAIKDRKAKKFEQGGSLLGTAVGAYFGGVKGASVGAKLGGAVGGLAGGKSLGEQGGTIIKEADKATSLYDAAKKGAKERAAKEAAEALESSDADILADLEFDDELLNELMA